MSLTNCHTNCVRTVISFKNQLYWQLWTLLTNCLWFIIDYNGFHKVPLPITGVHPCSCKSPNLPAPDTQTTNTDGRALCQTCVTRWVGRGGVGNTCFSNRHVMFTIPAIYKRSKKYVFEKNLVMFMPHLNRFRGA